MIEQRAKPLYIVCIVSTWHRSSLDKFCGYICGNVCTDRADVQWSSSKHAVSVYSRWENIIISKRYMHICYMLVCGAYNKAKLLKLACHLYVAYYIVTSPPEGVARYCFHPVCLSVCVCVSVYLCVRPIFWYFISRLLEEISIWNLYRILIGLYSIH